MNKIPTVKLNRELMLRPSAYGFKLDTRLFSAKLGFLDTWRLWRHTRLPAEVGSIKAGGKTSRVLVVLE